MTKKEIRYPFIPKSNKHFIAGQFFDVRLKNGKYACGRVLALPPPDWSRYGGRTCFLAGLMDWVGDHPPTSEGIAGHKIIQQGVASIRIITRHGSGILGQRPLEIDGISLLEPFRYIVKGTPPTLYSGYVSSADTESKSDNNGQTVNAERDASIYRSSSGWGLEVMALHAEEYYEKGILKP